VSEAVRTFTDVLLICALFLLSISALVLVTKLP
jgi:hypothetical protein